MSIDHIIVSLNEYAWGLPSILFLVCTGLFLTVKLGAIQLRGFIPGIKVLFSKTDPGDVGEITKFQALSTALSATVGTGNIAGVATAITLGGPGAVFWMWVTAVVGMATKFASCSLAIKYRKTTKYGVFSGGPMYTLSRGLNMPVLGGAFALFTLIASFGIGCTVQANSIVEGVSYIFPHLTLHRWALGCIIAFLVGLVIIGDVKRIARVASYLVPFMALGYCLAAMLILLLHANQITTAFSTIFHAAFHPAAVGGGTLGATIRYGVSRGVFSNEAGLGSCAIAHAAAKTNSAVRQGLVAMMGPFIDTILICTMTALVIIIMHDSSDLDGAALSAHAFSTGLTGLGGWATHLGAWIVGAGLVFFAYTTIIAWNYYGTRCVEYLFSKHLIQAYNVVFLLMIIIGSISPLQSVWHFADIANICMAVPNLISVILLSGVLKSDIQDYFASYRMDKIHAAGYVRY